MKANMLSLHTPLTPGEGSKGFFFFSESGHVAYQIEVKAVKTNMQGHTPLTSGVGLDGQILRGI